MTENKVLVCVTEQAQCVRLISKGRALADARGAHLLVLHVRTRQKTMMGNPDISAALNQLYADARAADAEMEIIASPEVEKTICEYVRAQQAACLVIGESPRDSRPTMREKLSACLPDVDIVTVPSSD